MHPSPDWAPPVLREDTDAARHALREDRLEVTTTDHALMYVDAYGMHPHLGGHTVLLQVG